MPTEYVTRTGIAVDHHGRGEARLDFPRAAGKGKPRAAAARRLAVIYKVTARHPWRTLHYNPASPDAPAPTPDELRLDLSGDPERLARFLSAVPRYLARVEALATKAARVYGRWARSVAAEEALEYVDAGGRRAYAARFRAEAFAAVADYLGITGLPPLPLDSSRPMWDQARAVAYDVAKAEGPVELRAMHDQAEAEEILARADRTPDPAAVAFERELGELYDAQARRSARLFAALGGEELPADEEPVEEAAAEDVVEDQEDEELVEAPLTRVQRRWLHTAAAHPAGHFPNGCNLRTLAALEAAGYVEWVPRYNFGPRVRIADSLKPNPGTVRITEAGRRRAAREERERVVIVPCGGRKAVWTDGLRKGEPVPVLPAGEMYVGSYHRAARRAADALTRGGRSGRVLILSAKHGLVELTEWIITYELRAGDPGTVDGETLRKQAHELGISGAAVTVLGGRAYVDLAREAFPDLDAPLAGTRGIGEQLARLASIYDPARRPAEAAVAQLVEDQADELAPAEATVGALASPAPARRAELAPALAGRRGRHFRAGGRPVSRAVSRGPLSRPVTCGDSPASPGLRRARQGAVQGGGAPCHPYRWTVARRGDEGPVIGHGERVHRPVIGLAAAALALLATAGCVSVSPADGRASTPRHRPAAPVPVPAFTAAEVRQAPAVEELVTTGPAPSSVSAAPPRPQRRAPAGTPSARVERRLAEPRTVRPPAPPRRERPAPVRRPAPRPAHPAPRIPERAPSSAEYGMRDVCRAAQGVTDPSLAALCRDAYGG
ncbi:DUF6884 domain-containing protein [Streptomyces candidus]|uniref:DUF6884 domain-containing protein n=1 Tax=Streptomyces candidus TaxID=67283 RepID=A0A7X0HLM0_9ACTN|nr:DUF6884 domain-containing protein [Streptomyces candidus]MBB6439967.1 hypothetical protein [Streptomyces candidus]GHH56082.1 hypothetical protein GCM10018773_61400 [Streptomyces candidus]